MKNSTFLVREVVNGDLVCMSTPESDPHSQIIVCRHEDAFSQFKIYNVSGHGYSLGGDSELFFPSPVFALS